VHGGNEFYAMAGILAAAGAAALVAARLRQPVIVAFIAVGIGVGPFGLGLVSPGDQIEVLARLGIAVLLFLVGLRLDLHLIRETGPVALATGIGQIVFTSLVGFLLGLALGFGVTTAVYVAIALTFSSTIIIVKLLSDKRELEELHGRIAVGFLIVQDLAVIAMLIGLTAFAGDARGSVVADVALTLGKGAGLLLAVVVVVRYALIPVMTLAARSSEVLLLVGVAWAVGLAAVTDRLGFSTEIGAFLAGVAVASTPFRDALGARLTTLRDFLLLFFFLDLGATLEFARVGEQAGAAALFSAFVLFGNPLIVLVIMGAMGYPSRVSFLAGLTVAQISEFSLILASLGYSLGHIDRSTLGLVTLVGLITISGSTYLILYSKPLYERLAPILRHFERRRVRDGLEPGGSEASVVVMGLGRLGGAVVRRLGERGIPALGVDLDPIAVSRMRRLGFHVLLGDAESLDLLDAIPLGAVGWVVSTVPNLTVNRALLHELDVRGYRGRVVLRAANDRDRSVLADLGGAVVVQPHALAAEAVVDLLARDGAPEDAPAPPSPGGLGVPQRQDAPFGVDDRPER